MLAFAVIVTADDVARAVRGSPGANAFLLAHADEVGQLALKVEDRSGDTRAYNGSCCYGILQMNTTNIRAAGYTVEGYRNATLQQQVDAWTELQSQALKDRAISTLAGMSTFDGQPVDASLMIACIQLGQGNCRKMISSGHCSGFADSLGTTICAMAAKMRAAIGGSSSWSGSGSSTTSGTSSAQAPDPYSGMPEGAFSDASGVSISQVREAITLIVASLLTVWLGWTTNTHFASWRKGRLSFFKMQSDLVRGCIVLGVMVVMLT